MNKNIFKIIYGLFLLLLIAVAGILTLSFFNIPGNYKLLVVESGSMEPAIKTGSIVVVKPALNYRVGDIITVYDSANHKVSVTHRIYDIQNSGLETVITTKGDANETPDTETRNPKDIVGKVTLTIPFLGYPINFAKTREGLLLLIIIPSVAIIVSELISVKNQIGAMVNKRKSNVKRFNLGKILVLALFSVLSLMPFGVSRAYYSDSLQSSASFSAATWEDPISLNFYKESDGHHVGFSIKGAGLAGFESLNYLVTYDTDQTPQGISGVKTINGAAQITENNLFLGYCSSLGSCVNFTGVKNIKISVTLSGNGIGKTLEQTI